MIDQIRKILRKHIEPRFYAGLWLLAVILTACILWFGIDDYVLQPTPRNTGTIAVIAPTLAVILATMGWIWNGKIQLDMARRTNSLHLLSRIADRSVNDLKDVVYPYIIEYDRYLNEKRRTKPKTPKDEIEKLLGFYEQVSVAVLKGAVDEPMIHASQELIFDRIYRGLHHHIQSAQHRDKRYFSSFEGLACRWHPGLEKHAAEKHPTGSLFDPLSGA